MDVIRTYDEEDGWVEYMEQDGKVYMSAHTPLKRYPKRMMINIARTFLTFPEVYTILPYEYLVKFYDKHTNLELIDSNTHLYRVYGRKK